MLFFVEVRAPWLLDLDSCNSLADDGYRTRNIYPRLLSYFQTIILFFSSKLWPSCKVLYSDGFLPFLRGFGSELKFGNYDRSPRGENNSNTSRNMLNGIQHICISLQKYMMQEYGFV